MSEIILKPAELSYLLQTFKAESVLGVDDAELFPENEAENNVLLKEGRDLLIDHGWLTSDEEGRMSFNPELGYLAAVMVDPDAVVLTLQKEEDATRQLVAHYLADEVIVEQLRLVDGDFQLGFVPSLETAVARIESAFQLDVVVAGQPEDKILLSAATFAQVKDEADTGKRETAVAHLGAQGMDAASASALVQAMQTPLFQGMAVIIQREGERLSANHSLSVLQGQLGCWLIRWQNLGDAPMMITAYTPQGFQQHLINLLENQAIRN